MILFNALVTGKRIIFLGHNRPAGQVSSYVLSACALGSGCGAVLRGFIERAFPYANLTNRDEWESMCVSFIFVYSVTLTRLYRPAYIAGVCNPIFETSGSWDLLMDVGGGRVVVSKDIHISFPPTSVTSPISPQLIIRTGTLKAEGSVGNEDDIGRGREGQRSEFTARTDSVDNLFLEDVSLLLSKVCIIMLT
jgi:Stabilization of polarity axis